MQAGRLRHRIKLHQMVAVETSTGRSRELDAGKEIWAEVTDQGTVESDGNGRRQTVFRIQVYCRYRSLSTDQVFTWQGRQYQIESMQSDVKRTELTVEAVSGL